MKEWGMWPLSRQSKELSKPKPVIIYLPTAQRPPESFFQPLPID